MSIEPPTATETSSAPEAATSRATEPAAETQPKAPEPAPPPQQPVSKPSGNYILAGIDLGTNTSCIKAINAEERVNGIRACAIYPGDINTPLLDKRPNPPAMELRPKMLQPADLVACVMLCLNLPPNAVAEEILLRPA